MPVSLILFSLILFLHFFELSPYARLNEYASKGVVDLKSTVSMLVVDEADLVLSYGNVDDINSLLPHLPKM
jgi:superfamily II DNA/RNA helicase